MAKTASAFTTELQLSGNDLPSQSSILQSQHLRSSHPVAMCRQDSARDLPFGFNYLFTFFVLQEHTMGPVANCGTVEY